MKNTINILSNVKRIKERDIIKVEIDNKIQPFYKSSGKNSKKPGCWLPFDGIVCFEGNPVWFDKSRYVTDGDKVPNELHRYGTSALKKISDRLANIDIPEGIESTCNEINEWLDYPNRLKNE